MKFFQIVIAMIVFLLIIHMTELSNVFGSKGNAYFMKTNSTAKIYANFTFPIVNNRTWNISPSIYQNLHSNELVSSKDLSITANPDSITANTKNVVVIYTITEKNDIKGTYALFLYYCGLSPLVVGLDESEVSNYTFNQFFNATYNCPNLTYDMPQINIVGYSNMISKIIDTDSDARGKELLVSAINTTQNKINEVNSIHSMSTGSPVYPLKQYESGISVNRIVCQEGWQLIVKAEDGSPACVKPNTVNILIERGWGHLP